ncbi:hypothetical protein MML48_1g15078 [Holotrichia oblita]|uniref:Uncharacterized protein n=1 Tax=Holotrichia oblita TaxID=644536 RepID=A0ACB9TV93_HOLOL|nr:hypothetical protein MML48_1g15078 [Holotrichia oblita]
MAVPTTAYSLGYRISLSTNYVDMWKSKFCEMYPTLCVSSLEGDSYHDRNSMYGRLCGLLKIKNTPPNRKKIYMFHRRKYKFQSSTEQKSHYSSSAPEKICIDALVLMLTSIATRASSALVIIISFLDSQLSFCSMQTIPKQEKSKIRGSHEQVSDIEYIIPRRKSSKPHTVYNAYPQSWVYDTDTGTIATAATSNNHVETSSYLQIPQEGTPKASLMSTKRKSGLENGIISDTAHLIDNPVVHIEEASDDSNSNSDRKLCYMKSFSRSASPVVLSASSSQISLNNPPIYEYLQKLTDPEIYRSRLNSALSNKSDEGPQYQAPQPIPIRREPVSPNVEKVQYASLMKELQKAIVSKKEPPSQISPSSNSESVTSSEKTQSKNSDAEFSKELEAALQLIQDLESPNTIETPSEPKVFGEKEDRSLTVWRNSDASESEKTLSAVGSLAEITSPLNECQPEMTTFKPVINGKGTRVIIQNPQSQSTSGYSSPTHKTPNWSTTSSVSSSNHDIEGATNNKPMSYTIHNTKSTAVISLYAGESPKTKNVTLVNITPNNQHLIPLHNSTPFNEYDLCNNNNVVNIDNKTFNDHSNIENIHDENFEYDIILGDYRTDDENSGQEIQRRPSINSAHVWNVKSLLRKKKSVPKLGPELEVP